jgi:hypothetical protein
MGTFSFKRGCRNTPWISGQHDKFFLSNDRLFVGYYCSEQVLYNFLERVSPERSVMRQRREAE